MDISKPLSHLLINKGLTSQDLACDLSVATNTVSTWKTGKATPNRENFKKILDKFDMKESEFFALAED